MNRFVSTSITLFCVVAVFVALISIGCGTGSGNGNTGGNGNTTSTPKSTLKVDCSSGNPTNEQITDAIYAAIALSSYANEVKQFNITAAKPNITIVGWSDHKTDIENLIRGAAVGCALVDGNFAGSSASLGSNYQQRIACPPDWGTCGDICIPQGELCKVTNRPADPSAWSCVAVTPTPTPGVTPAMSPTPTPAATPSKSP